MRTTFWKKKIEHTQGELAVIAKKGPHAPLCVHYIIITRRVEEEAGAACKDRHLIENKQERSRAADLFPCDATHNIISIISLVDGVKL